VNKIYHRSGGFGREIQASLIDAEAYLLTCYRYIELNPVRADMVRDPANTAGQATAGRAWEHNELITGHPLYTALGSSETERKHPTRTVQAQLDEAALDEIRKASSRGLPLGSERFREQVERH